MSISPSFHLSGHSFFVPFFQLVQWWIADVAKCAGSIVGDKSVFVVCVRWRGLILHAAPGFAGSRMPWLVEIVFSSTWLINSPLILLWTLLTFCEIVIIMTISLPLFIGSWCGPGSIEPSGSVSVYLMFYLVSLPECTIWCPHCW